MLQSTASAMRTTTSWSDSLMTTFQRFFLPASVASPCHLWPRPDCPAPRIMYAQSLFKSICRRTKSPNSSLWELRIASTVRLISSLWWRRQHRRGPENAVLRFHVHLQRVWGGICWRTFRSRLVGTFLQPQRHWLLRSQANRGRMTLWETSSL